MGAATRRHDALLPLTHDHHHALAQARALIGAAGAYTETRTRVAETFLRFYSEETLVHFHEEEELLFPLLLDHVTEAPPELVHVLVDHVRIHGMVSELRGTLSSGPPDGEQLRRLGETLRSHVRLEENDLFPLIERALSDATLSRLTFAERRRGR